VPVKRKSISKKLVLIIIIDILVIAGVVFTAMKLWPNEKYYKKFKDIESMKEDVDKKSFDSIIYSLNFSNAVSSDIILACGNVTNVTSVQIRCVSRVLVTKGYLNEATNLCDKIEDVQMTLQNVRGETTLKLRCLAFVVAQTNHNEGMKMCDDAPYFVQRNMCKLRILQYAYNRTENQEFNVTEFCNKSNNTDEKYGCFALLFSGKQNWEQSIKYCDKIENSDEKIICIESINYIRSEQYF